MGSVCGKGRGQGKNDFAQKLLIKFSKVTQFFALYSSKKILQSKQQVEVDYLQHFFKIIIHFNDLPFRYIVKNDIFKVKPKLIVKLRLDLILV